MGPGAEQLPMTLESASFSSCDPKGYIDKVSMVFGLGDTSISLKKPRPQREIGVWRIVVLLARDGRLFGTKRLGASKLVCLAFIHGRDLVVVAPCHKMGVGLGLRLSESNARAAYTACLDTALFVIGIEELDDKVFGCLHTRRHGLQKLNKTHPVCHV